MSIINQLEDKQYVLSEDELKELMELGAASDSVSTKIKGDYFRILKECTFNYWSADDCECQYLDALDIVYRKHYKIIKSVYTKNVKDSIERNRLTNFARSAKSTLTTMVTDLGKTPSEIPNTKSECTKLISSLRTKAKPLDPYDQHFNLIKEASRIYMTFNEEHKRHAREDLSTQYNIVIEER